MVPTSCPPRQRPPWALKQRRTPQTQGVTCRLSEQSPAEAHHSPAKRLSCSCRTRASTLFFFVPACTTQTSPGEGRHPRRPTHGAWDAAHDHTHTGPPQQGSQVASPARPPTPSPGGEDVRAVARRQRHHGGPPHGPLHVQGPHTEPQDPGDPDTHQRAAAEGQGGCPSGRGPAGGCAGGSRSRRTGIGLCLPARTAVLCGRCSIGGGIQSVAVSDHGATTCQRVCRGVVGGRWSRGAGRRGRPPPAWSAGP